MNRTFNRKSFLCLELKKDFGNPKGYEKLKSFSAMKTSIIQKFPKGFSESV